MSGARRWRGTDVPPSSVAVVAPQIVVQRSQRRTIRVPKVRDGNITSPPFGQAAANTNQPVLVRPPSIRRSLRVPPIRRADLMSPPWPQVAASPNPAITELTGRRPRLQRQGPREKRARLWIPPWQQAAANTNQPYLAFVWQARRRVAWLRRRLLALTPLAQADVLPPIAQPDQRREERFGPIRRGELAVPPLDQGLPLSAGNSTRRRAGIITRRARRAEVTAQSTPVVNPSFTDWTRRRLTIRVPRPPHGRLIEIPWGQAVAALPPVFTDWLKRRVLVRMWPLAARARKSEAPVPQVAAPVNPPFVATAALRRRALSILARRARLASVIGSQDMPSAQASRRPRPLSTRRARLLAVLGGQDLPPVQTLYVRRRALAAQRRRPLLGFIPAQVILPNPAIVEFIRVPTRIRQWLRQRAGRFFVPGWGQAVGPRLASSGVSYAQLATVGRSQSLVGSAGVSWLVGNTVVVAQTAPSVGASVSVVNTVGISYVPLY